MKFVILSEEKVETVRFCKKHRLPLVLRESGMDLLTPRRRWQCSRCQDEKLDREFRQWSRR